MVVVKSEVTSTKAIDEMSDVCERCNFSTLRFEYTFYVCSGLLEEHYENGTGLKCYGKSTVHICALVSSMAQ